MYKLQFPSGQLALLASIEIDVNHKVLGSAIVTEPFDGMPKVMASYGAYTDDLTEFDKEVLWGSLL